MKTASILTAATLIMAATPTLAEVVVDHTISEAEVLAAQEGWCQALVNISNTHAENGQAAAAALAEEIIDAAYGYQMGAVLFKPTLAVNPQTFRTTRTGALSYFVGGNEDYPDDNGFALNGWTNCEIDNAAVLITGNSASTMGKVHFTGPEGDIVSVDKTWQFMKDNAGQLRIVLHHSSLEFTGE